MAKEAKPKTREAEEASGGRKTELVARFKELLHKKYKKELNKASLEEKALVIDFPVLSKFSYELGEALLSEPDFVFEVARDAVEAMELPAPVPVRFMNIPELTSIRDVRSRHIKKFLCVEGTVRRASEIRPEIQKVLWECPECGDIIEAYSEVGMIRKPFACNCGNRTGFKKKEAVLVDTRWVTIEEPFELTEGDRPSQINVVLIEDLVSPEGRRMTDPGNRIKVTGILRETPKGKVFSSKLDLFVSANHVEATEVGWHQLDVTEEEVEEIKRLAKDPKVYELLIGSLAPSLYGLKEIKESIILQLFGGVPKRLRDKTNIRGDIHIMLIGDPASGKCVTGDTRVLLKSGELKPIKEIVERKLNQNSSRIDDGFFARGNDDIISLSQHGKLHHTKADIFWKRTSPDSLYRIKTCSGKEIKVTPTHPVFVCSEGLMASKKARELKGNEYIATPRRISVQGEPQKIDISIERSKAGSARHIKVPERVTPELSRFLAYIIAEGYIQRTKTTCLVWFTNNNPVLLKDFRKSASIFGIPIHDRVPHKGKSSFDIYLSSVELWQFLREIDTSLFEKSRRKRVPDIIMKSPNKEVRAFLQVLFDTEGSIMERGIELTTASRELAEQLQVLLLRFGILSQLHKTMKMATNSPEPKLREYYRLGITGRDVDVFRREIGFSIPEKKNRLDALDIKKSISDVYPDLSRTLLSIRKKLRMTQFDMGISRSAYQHYERGDRNPTEEWLARIVESFEKRIRSLERMSSEIRSFDIKDLARYRRWLGVSQDYLAKQAGISQGLVTQYELGKLGRACIKPRRKSVEQSTRKIKNSLISICDSMLNDRELAERIMKLKMLIESDVFWDRIKSIERINSGEEWVYDLQVPTHHNFIANNLFVHNSQLMKLVPEIVPRGKYVSGKGTTGAGLTATVTKDEQFMGGWVLEAGAMVLANKGMLAVDEFEKMSPEDQVAMHEGLEQQSVSIAKASIVATLPAKTSVLAGGNPKFSRFDPYVPIAKQITVPDTLLTRFDLKFALRDVPDSEQDKRVVDHVLKTREDENYEGAVPKIDPDFIRKYISYAREHFEPKFNREAGRILRNFYIRTRKKAEGATSSVSITMRQFEALLRLAEASARIQLQPEIRKEDAQRAIKLMKASLSQLGFDPETGEIDVDRSEGGTPASERSKIRIVLDLIDTLSKTKKEISVEELKSSAVAEGVDEVDEIIERLKTQGLLFEPSPGFVQKV